MLKASAMAPSLSTAAAPHLRVVLSAGTVLPCCGTAWGHKGTASAPALLLGAGQRGLGRDGTPEQC